MSAPDSDDKTKEEDTCGPLREELASAKSDVKKRTRERNGLIGGFVALFVLYALSAAYAGFGYSKLSGDERARMKANMGSDPRLLKMRNFEFGSRARGAYSKLKGAGGRAKAGMKRLGGRMKDSMGEMNAGDIVLNILGIGFIVFLCLIPYIALRYKKIEERDCSLASEVDKEACAQKNKELREAHAKKTRDWGIGGAFIVLAVIVLLYFISRSTGSETAFGMFIFEMLFRTIGFIFYAMLGGR